MADERSDPAQAARGLLYAERHGVLSTISVHRAGYPYGSVTPYAISRRGAPLVLISTIAEHTKNLERDARASLFVQERAALDDPQAGGRISLLGLCRPVTAVAAAGGLDPVEEEADARARYLGRFPKAEGYFRTHDFVLYEHLVEEVRVIGGFGKICWLDGQRLRRDPSADPLAPAADGICRHMNDDHGEALLLYCRGLRKLADVESARMVGLDGLGFDVIAEPGSRRLRFEFPRELATPMEVRKAVVAMVAEARQALGLAAT
jgi:hypothetical protein